MNRASPEAIKAWSLPKLQEIVQRSYRECAFYRTVYQRRRYDPERFTTFEHFQDVPVVTKNDMIEFSLDDRSLPSPGRLAINTGGTSGETLTFYIDRRAFAREWAHMHLIWGRAGYHYRDMKITMRGRNLGDRIVKYNPVHNEWIVNTYADRGEVCAALSELLKTQKIRWVHGYPSIVSELVSMLAEVDERSTRILRNTLKGVLLGSEFPARQYIEPIKRILGIEPTAWYGHSEMCILAYEDSQNRYVPLHSYGLVEAVDDSEKDQRLVGTSCWNTASPFIRYDSGDRVSADVEGGILRTFSVTSGRIGDFVVSKDGERISLTSLIFGRHHAAFSSVRHVQVRQPEQGKIELLVVAPDRGLTPDDVMKGFDFSNVELDVTLRIVDEPVRTDAGKIRLLVV
ncbi:MAG: hypothetical protein K9G30_01305 [Parvibaculum sp.]|nr:hypothetical protein [Parvibaculum sp.]